jgi:selenocysteine lyase/cysteine desulfurase
VISVPPVQLAGDWLRVPCVDGSQRPYLSFDAAASTSALPSVLDAVEAFVPWYSSAQRAAGYKSQASAIAYQCARLAALTFAGRDTASDDVAMFCRDATEAIRHLAYRLQLSKDDVVITTAAEHHANLLPWSRTATCRYVECGKDGTFDTEDVVAALNQRPRAALLAITGASNITGWMPPLPQIIDAAHRRGVPVLADGAQLAPHRPLPADADFLAWSGHKMYAPFGTGVLVGPRRVLTDGDPFPAGLAVGGAADPGGLDEVVRALPPEREETSSPNVIGAIALHAAMDMLGYIGWPAIIGYERRIALSLRRGLAAIPGVRLLGPDLDAETLPVATFTVEGVPHALVAARLAAEYAIGVGHSRFCAYPYMIRLLGLTREEVHRYRDQARREDRRAMPGAVRASAGINVSDDDVQRLLAAVASIAAGDPPVRYHQDPSTGDFFPAESTFAERVPRARSG